MSHSKIETLLLYAQFGTSFSYFDDWKDAFESAPHFNVTALNICVKSNLNVVKKKVQTFDLIVLHHSAVGDTLEYINSYRGLLKSRKGKLLTFVGNEVNIPGGLVADKIGLISDLEVDFVGTQLPLAAGVWLYAECTKSRVVALPHALNPAAFSCTVEQRNRNIDIGVRTYKYTPYLGDNDRNNLIDFLISNKHTYSLNLDIDFTQRFGRNEWAKFLNQCRSTVSTEAGSFFLERDDRTMKSILLFCQQKLADSHKRIRAIDPQSIIYRLRGLAPGRVRRQFKKAFGFVNDTEISYLVSYEEIYDRFFKDYPPHEVYTKAISSRHFDAIGTKTCQIMLPGRFNDILTADEHYVAIKKDYSNLAECVRMIRDLDFRNALVNNAFDYVMSSHTYAHRMTTVAELVT